MIDLLPQIRLADAFDVLLVAVLLYVLLVTLRRTRTTFLIGGLFFFGVIYVAALAFGLRLTGFLFQVLFAVIALGLIILFQEELRISIERIFSWNLRRQNHVREHRSVVPPAVQMLVTVLGDFAKDRIGALVVVRGRDDLARFVHSGISLDGALSEELLKSIFDPHSTGHDGAVLIIDNRVVQFGAHLPLSTDDQQLKNRGTRHAAALGLSSKTDSLCLVVSEERGVISIARHGTLREVEDPGELSRTLDEFYTGLRPPQKATYGRDLLTRHLGLKLAAVGLAALLWFLVVHEGAIEYRSYWVPVGYAGLDSGLAVQSPRPTRVRVIVSGPRRSFYFVDSNYFDLHAKLFDLDAGTHEITLTATDVSLPSGITFVNVVPRNILVTINDELGETDAEGNTAAAPGPNVR